MRYTAEPLRIRKLESGWGAVAYHLVDPFPGIGFGVLDGARRPKLALDALRAAFRATRLIVEPLAFEPARPFGFTQHPRVPFAARLVIVNDDPALAGRGQVRWSSRGRRRPGQGDWIAAPTRARRNRSPGRGGVRVRTAS